MPIERKLAAIMFTDIAGYTAQMSKDEAVAISLLNKQESILKPLILEHNGTYVKSTGDGSLSHFNSAVDAATCDKRLKESIYDDKDLNVRVGVHLGDTIFEKGDIRGDGVNIASRLESMAVAGGVFVSKEVHDQLANQKEFEGVSLGLQCMKGVGRLIEVYGLKGDKLSEPNPSEYQENKIAVHTDDEVPSIAIIPFENKGADEDVFYTYGISVDLISDVTSAGLIRVASKKRIEDAGELPIGELAKVLDVRYMANGELWRMEDMFQLSVELYDTKDKKVIWSDRWQENWDNLPMIKGNLSDGLLKALDTTSKVEKRIETTNTEAYEFYLKAIHKYAKRENTDDTEIVRGLLNKAIELDNNLIIVKLFLGVTYSQIGDYDKAMEIFTSALKQTDELGDKRGMGYSLSNIGNVYKNKGDYDKALDYYGRSLEIKEELGNKRGVGALLNNIGAVYHDKGDDDKALGYYTRSLKIKEELGDKGEIGASLNNIGIIYFVKGDYDKAIELFEQTIELNPDYAKAYYILGVIYYKQGNYIKAIQSYEQAIELNPNDALAYSNLGAAYNKQGNYIKAIELYVKAIELNPDLAMTYYNLGSAYYNIGNSQQQISSYKKAAKLGHQPAQDWLKKNGYDW